MKNDLYRQLFENNSKPQAFASMAEEKKDEEDIACCRYCRMPGGDLISPCECKGGNKWTHKECLAKWQYQAILSQSTHRKYQTGIESVCNVCESQFRYQMHTREKLILSFSGAEIASMIEPGCLLVSTEKSSKYNTRLMEQYEELRERLSHWTSSVFLISECLTREGGKKQTIVGLNLTREIDNKRAAPYNSKTFSKLGLGAQTRSFIGGPCSPDIPHILLLVQTSKLSNPNPPTECQCHKVLQGSAGCGGDLSLWYPSAYMQGNARQALAWAGDALVEVRLYWGCATW